MKALFTLLLLISSCTSHRSTTIDIGEVGSLTGSEASFGNSQHNGVQLAIDQVNAAGGVLGRKLRVISLDDQGKPDEAATAVTQLIAQKKVIAVLGEVASTRSLAMAPIAQRYQIPMISPTSTNPAVTQVGDYIFRACFIDRFQAIVMAKFATETLKLRSVALLRDVKNDYSVGLAAYFSQEFRSRGGQILIEQSYSSGDVDFKAQLTSIRSKNPQAIYIPGYYTEIGLIARQARELGIKVPLLGGDGWDSPKLQEIGGPALEGSYFSDQYSTDDESLKARTFLRDYTKAYGFLPDGNAALGYDSAMLLVDAMNRSKSFNPKEIRNALASTRDLEGVAGKITMDSNRNPIKPAVIFKIDSQGVSRYLTSIN